MKEDQASFVEKWAEADPAVRLLLLFAPRDRVEGVGLWLALLRELEDAAFNRSDVEISAAKLGFYARAFADGAESAHPLVRGWRERAAKDFGQRLVEAAHQLLDFAAASSSEALGEALGHGRKPRPMPPTSYSASAWPGNRLPLICSAAVSPP